MSGRVPRRISAALRRMANGLFIACVVIAAGARATTLPEQSPDTAATQPFRQLSQLQRTKLTAKDGVPSTIYAISEDRDGYLWLGGPSGLFRFDGVHFEPMFKGQIPIETISALFDDRDGNLWVGGLHGEVIRIHGGVAESVNRGLSIATVMSFKQTIDGTLWVVTSEGPATLADGVWHRVGASDGMDGKGVRVTGKGGDGSYWIFATDGAYRLRPSAKRFERYGSNEGFAAMANLPAAATYPGSGMTADLIADSSGALWVPSNGKLLRLHADNGSGQKLLVTEDVTTQGDHLDIPEVTADFADARGNIWVATSGALEQFRVTRFTPLVLPKVTVNPEVTDDRDGRLWIASHSNTPAMSVGNSVTVHSDIDGPTVCMAIDPQNGIWFSGGKGILRYKNGSVSAIPMPPSPGAPVLMQHPGLGCNDMKIAADGSLWISLQGYGVLRWDGQVWTTVDPHVATSIQLTGARAWLAFESGKLTSIGQGKTVVFSGQDGPELGPLIRIFAGNTGLWITGDEGVAVKIGPKFHRLVGANGERFDGAYDIVQLSNGDVWMTTIRGVYRVSAAEIQLASSAADHVVAYTIFDEEDGATGAGRIATSGEGLLWISMPQGVASIDATHVPLAPPAPRTSIVSINDHNVRFSNALVQTLEKGTRSVTVTYTAAALSMPSRTKFRYRINGIDDKWQTAGNRREAYYANLGPGLYAFQIEASNVDGVWADQPTKISFEIMPEFYQTWWFKVICAAFALAGLWLLHRLRVSYIYAELAARNRERENMARDFHDTILQSFQGLLLRLEGAALNVRDAATRERLETALCVTENVLNEGRNKIGQLRSLVEPLEDLSTDLSQLARSLSALHPMTFSMDVEGELRPLNALAATDVHAIAGELITNAFRHSRAATLHVKLQYGRRALIVVVTDDGDGVDPLKPLNSKPGHWGMQGMYERASRLGGRLTIGAVHPGKGTRAKLTVPARFVYVRKRLFGWWPMPNHGLAKVR